MNSGNKKSKQKISKNCLHKLGNYYFVLKIFDFILKKKKLEILKINKHLQNKLNLTLDDYKEYSQLYSSIEIELKLVKKNMINL